MRRVAAALASLVLSVSAGGNRALSHAPSLSLLRFSPNGRYVLAQDDSSIMVLTVQPFAFLFRIPAENALPAQFTPDSQQIVFVSSATHASSQRIDIVRSPPRVERWRVANQARVESTQVRLPPCGTQALSPDGSTVVCVDFGGTLHLVDVLSGQTIFERAKFGRQILIEDSALTYRYEYGDPASAIIQFSPDGDFIVAAPEGWMAVGSPVGFDLRQEKPMKLEGKLKDLEHFVFAFAGPTRLIKAYLDLLDPAVTAAVIAWPSGKVLMKTKIPGGGLLFQATDPGFILVRPFGQAAFSDPQAKRSAATELTTGNVIISETPALDVLGNHYVTQLTDGRVALYERGRPEPVATIRLDVSSDPECRTH